MTEWILLAVAVLLTAGTALFVAAEFAFVALDRSAVERAVEAGDHRSVGVLAALRRLSTQLSASQVGITLTTLLVGYLAEPSVASLLHGPLRALGVPDGAVEPVSVTAALVLATAFSMVLGELVPKNAAVADPLRIARVVAPPMRGFTTVARPLIAVLNGSANAFLRRVGVEPREELSSARTPDELASLVRHSAAAGTLDPGTAQLVTRTLGFGERTAADVMTPRVRLTTVHRDDTAADVVRLARQGGHSRFPVVHEGLDDVVGVVHVKKAVAVPPERRPDVPAAALMADVVMVPETVRLDPLLVQLRDEGLQLAVVLDEYGGTAGVVTLEDVVEELVGEVADEHDRGRTAAARRLRDGSWVLPGLLRPDEVRERAGADVPDSGAYETVGGYAMARLGRVPVLGDVVELPGGRLEVTRMEGRRVDRLRWTPDPDADRDAPVPAAGEPAPAAAARASRERS